MSKLPSGYTELEYIESSGTQYIDTGFKQNQNSRVVVDLQLLAAPSGSYAWIYEGRDSGPSNRHGVYATKSNGRWYGGYGSSTKNTGVSYDLTARLTVDFDKNVLTIGDVATEFTEATFQSDTTTTLFGCNTAGTVANFASCKLYSCQIYDNGALVRNFIPCKNTSGAVGLYDTVGAQFYANAGTGTFTAGPEIIPDPPAAPTALQTVLAVVLQWAASANADRYDVYRDGAKLGSTEGTQYVDATAEPNETYVYTVKAVNGGGESAGTSITVYTKSGYFEYKPLIESANFP